MVLAKEGKKINPQPVLSESRLGDHGEAKAVVNKKRRASRMLHTTNIVHCV